MGDIEAVSGLFWTPFAIKRLQASVVRALTWCSRLNGLPWDPSDQRRQRVDSQNAYSLYHLQCHIGIVPSNTSLSLVQALTHPLNIASTACKLRSRIQRERSAAVLLLFSHTMHSFS